MLRKHNRTLRRESLSYSSKVWEFVSAMGRPINLIPFSGEPTMQVIKFYRTAEEYGHFSNFAAYPVRLNGKRWPTTEHFYQAMKFTDVSDQDEIRGANSPMLAARMGREPQRTVRADWETVRVDFMRQATLAKFTEHAELRELLLATGDAQIIEHTKHDAFWGDGGDGSGENMLGKILMEVRQTLRDQAEEAIATEVGNSPTTPAAL